MSVTILATRQGEGGAELITPAPAADVETLRALRADPAVHLWVHIESGTDATRDLLGEVFGVHPLLLEDALERQDVPKLEKHGAYAYFIVHGPVTGADESGEMETGDVDFFVGERFLVTHHGQSFPDVAAVRETVRRHPDLLGRGPAVVAHRVVDSLIDRFVVMVDRFGEHLDGLDMRVLRDTDTKLLEEIFDTKQAGLRVARMARHQRNVLTRLAMGEVELVQEDVLPFFRDVLDHFMRIQDQLEGQRDLISDLLDGYLSMQSHRLNEVMKVLTLISTIMLPLTFITGLYGMNFDFMPGLHHRYGYEMAWGVMLGTSVLIYLYFKRKRWL